MMTFVLNFYFKFLKMFFSRLVNHSGFPFSSCMLVDGQFQHFTLWIRKYFLPYHSRINGCAILDDLYCLEITSKKAKRTKVNEKKIMVKNQNS